MLRYLLLITVVTCIPIQLSQLVLQHHNDSVFIRDIIGFIGIDKYNIILADIINSINSYDTHLDSKVDAITNLALYTDISLLKVRYERMPYLAHVFKYHMYMFNYYEELSDKSLSWFLSSYEPHMLNHLLRYHMTYISSSLLRYLYDIVSRDCEYVEYHDDYLRFKCISAKLSIEECHDIITYTSHCHKVMMNFVAKISRESDIVILPDSTWDTHVGKILFVSVINKELASKLINCTITAEKPNLYRLLINMI